MYPATHEEQAAPAKPVEQVQEQEPAVPETLDAWLLQSVAFVHCRSVSVTAAVAVAVPVAR